MANKTLTDFCKNVDRADNSSNFLLRWELGHNFVEFKGPFMKEAINSLKDKSLLVEIGVMEFEPHEKLLMALLDSMTTQEIKKKG